MLALAGAFGFIPLAQQGIQLGQAELAAGSSELDDAVSAQFRL